VTIEVCVLASGSSGNCIYVASKNTKLLVDCGVAAKVVVARLESIGVDPHTLDGVLVTHAHNDHYKAAGTIHWRFDVPVYTERGTVKAIRQKKCQYSFTQIDRCHDIPPRIGDIRISPFPVPHYSWWGTPGNPVGFVLRHGGKKIGIATDLGTVPGSVARALKGSNVMVLEANYHVPILKRKLADPGYSIAWPYLRWVKSKGGHLSNVQCGEALTRIITDRTTHVFLAHMSVNHKDPDEDNNDYRAARRVINEILDEENIDKPDIVRTYRRGMTEGRRSKRVIIE
jgi:phosphoribosyl 1,2-cyclic phosphodiesterase